MKDILSGFMEIIAVPTKFLLGASWLMLFSAIIYLSVYAPQQFFGEGSTGHAVIETEVEKNELDLINMIREDRGLEPISWNIELEELAKKRELSLICEECNTDLEDLIEENSTNITPKEAIYQSKNRLSSVVHWMENVEKELIISDNITEGALICRNNCVFLAI